MASFGALQEEVFARQQRKQHFDSYIKGLNAYERHKKFMRDYVHHYGAPSQQPIRPIKTDADTLRETYRFIRSEEDDSERSWEQRLAKRYYDKLFKEYCLADMSRYKESKVGLRWRTEKEVIAGKGQFICGNKDCNAKEELCSYEVNFVYKEAGESKQALVKLRLCPGCAYKLNYKKEKEKKRQMRKEQKEETKKKRRVSEEEETPGRAPRGADQNVAQGPSEERDKDEYAEYFKGMFS
ncbi:protein FRA10AC1 [Selaginella moellendorffii]|uniref:protein FRA10AC1 n=1 Tax=Selaginella moellendorffii TaxID=88036 RepID=UPI000D1CFC31|nr:protein FRA10AC1 [Selaginella moellendorffii]|eukprot:XP_002981847.2 protein FRA10AC1 [Selaginella moellendorffii]